MGKHITVSGFRQPVARSARSSIRPVPLVRPANLVGVVGTVVVLGAGPLWGTPHLLLATTSSGFGSTRWYDDCAYAGLDGRMVHLRGGSCPFLRLLRGGR